jgi:hypothetical protein
MLNLSRSKKPQAVAGRLARPLWWALGAGIWAIVFCPDSSSGYDKLTLRNKPCTNQFEHALIRHNSRKFELKAVPTGTRAPRITRIRS